MPGAESRGRRVKVPVWFDRDLFEVIRRRAEREGACFGDVVIALCERGMGG